MESLSKLRWATGWIQLVVATPDVEELPWAGRIVLWIVPLRQGGGVLGVRRRDGGSIGFGFGRRSLEVHRAKTLQWRLVSCRALVSGGFARGRATVVGADESKV